MALVSTYGVGCEVVLYMSYLMERGMRQKSISYRRSFFDLRESVIDYITAICVSNKPTCDFGFLISDSEIDLVIELIIDLVIELIIDFVIEQIIDFAIDSVIDSVIRIASLRMRAN